MSYALVVGEFHPPVLDDLALVDRARERVGAVVVGVVSSPATTVPAPQRVAWLSRSLPGVPVVALDEATTDAVVRTVGSAPAAVAGAPALATAWGATVLEDGEVAPARRRAAADPAAAWADLPAPVRGGLTRRVCFVGAESSGKTTLSRLLAERHHTTWVPEYGRDYTVDKIAAGTNDHWDSDDFVVIARRQGELEDRTADDAGPLLFCDTDAFATAVWHERYLHFRHRDVEAVADARRYDLYVLCGIEVPFEPDGVRFSEHIRPWMQQRFRDGLRVRPWREPWIELTGPVEARVATLEAGIERLGLLTTASMLASSRWAPATRPLR